MVGSTKELGEQAKCTARESSSGQTEENTTESIRTTKRTAMEFSLGKKAKLSPAHGRTASGPEKERSAILTDEKLKKTSPGTISNKIDAK